LKAKKKLTAQEISNMTDDEKRRYENSTLGDGLEDRLDDFFVKHQDANYNNGNFEFSGVSRDEEDDAIERQNIQ
jgi:hypothetical protein